MITEERKKELRDEIAAFMDRDMNKHRSEEYAFAVEEWITKNEEEEEYLFKETRTYVVCEEI